MDKAPIIFDNDSFQNSFAEGYRSVKYATIKELENGMLWVIKCLTLNPVEISRTLLKNTEFSRAKFLIEDSGAVFEVESIVSLLDLPRESHIKTMLVTHRTDSKVVYDVFDPSISVSEKQEILCRDLTRIINEPKKRDISEMTRLALRLSSGVVDVIDRSTRNMLLNQRYSPDIKGNSFDFGADGVRFYVEDDRRLVVNTYVAPNERLSSEPRIAVPDITNNVFGPFDDDDMTNATQV